MPVVGYLSQGTPDGGTTAPVAAVRPSFGEARPIEGKDSTGEFCSACYDGALRPGLATDLVRRQVAVIIALDTVVGRAPMLRSAFNRSSNAMFWGYALWCTRCSR